MKVTVLREHLQTKLTLVNHGVSSKNQLPVLLHILLEAQKGFLILSSTDLEIGIIARVTANIEEEGSITVPAKLFTELISSLSEEKITLELQEKSLVIKTQKTKSTLSTIEANEFPKLYEEKGDKITEIPAEVIQKDFIKVAFSVSADSTRPALSGILIKKEEDKALFVATDGYRLSLKKENIVVKTKEEETEKHLLVPARVIREVMNIKEEGNLSVYVSFSNNQVIFEQGETTIVGRLIDATYPSYEKIIPSNTSIKAVFDKEEMFKAIKLSSLFARDNANIIKFTVSKAGIEVSAQTPSLGQNTVSVEAKVQGEENEIAFNARYLLDLFSHLSEEIIEFEMTGPLSPGVFKIAGDSSFLHLIMPIRVQQ